MSSNGTPAIFATLKQLPEDRKQMINNWVRETHGRPNVAIWSVKCAPSERDELNDQIVQAIESDDWSQFEVAEAKGQAVASAPTNPEPQPEAETVETTTEEEVEGETVETKAEEKVERNSGMDVDIRGLLEEEVARRLELLKDGLRAQVIEEIRKALRHEKS